MRRAWIGAAIVLATLTALGAQAEIVDRTGFLMGDFRAFYCAARVVSHAGDPYRTEPLRSCETSIGSQRFFEKNPGVTIPAPLPGYAIAALVPLSLLPFGFAATLWTLLLLLAWIACVAALARFAGVSWEIALGVFALSLGVISLPFGEVVPVALAFICLSAYCAWRGRRRAAALCAAGAMIEPHLGLPICLALAVWMPQTRVVLALSLGGLAALSLALIGPAANLEYFTSVLPAHALSEVTRDTQYSLTAVLSAFGISQVTAVRAGMLWYVAMLAAGALAGGMLAKRTRNHAFLVCVPPAFAVFGGTFIHITQLAAALPAAALVIAYSARSRALAVVTLLLLAVPWVWAISPALILAPAFPVAYLAWRYFKGNARVALLAGLGAAVLGFGLMELAVAAPHTITPAVLPSIDPHLAEASWSIFAHRSSTNSIAAWLLRVPTWAGLALLLGLVLREAGALRLNFSRAPAIALAAVCTVLPMAAQLYGDRAGGWLMVDFRAYYCASQAQRAEMNPYFVQPLHDCERSTPAPYYHATPNVTIPAPYPPYVLAFLTPLTFLPFGAAAIAWWILMAFAGALAVYALARVSGQPLLVAWAALALSLGLVSFSSGNILPLALAAIVLAALCLQRGRVVAAVLAIAFAMVEPHIALPAAVALFVAYPSIRLALACALALLGAISVFSAGLAQTLAYVTAVLPAHALAEVSRDNQYSLATIAASFGLSDGAAVVAGSISYLLMIVLGVLVALRLARRYDDPALILLVPPAFALLGGSFVHTVEIAAAVPACLVLFARSQSYRGWLFGALILLAVPWMLATSAALFLAPIFPAGYLTYALWRGDRAWLPRVALASFAAIAALFLLSSFPATHALAHNGIHPAIDPRLAEASWRALVLSNTTNRPVMWLLRFPTWVGLVAFALPALMLAGKPRLMLAAQSS